MLGPIDDLDTHRARNRRASCSSSPCPRCSAALMQRVVAAVRTRPACRSAWCRAWHDMLEGRSLPGELKEVAIEDLLGRSPVMPDWKAIRGWLGGRSVLVTGAGGSIGSELCRQCAGTARAASALLEIDELALDHHRRRTAARFPRPGLRAACSAIAATRRSIAHALRAGRTRCGLPRRRLQAGAAARRRSCAKRCATTCWPPTPSRAPAAKQRRRHLRADLHRQGGGPGQRAGRDQAPGGNGLPGAASTGVRRASSPCASATCSIRPAAWCRCSASRSARGGPVTVTDPEVTRYFMTIPEACQLILQASAIGSHEAVYTLDMGEPVAIRVLAEQMIRLAGKQPGRDIAIVYTGPAPGREAARDAVPRRRALSPDLAPEDPAGRAARRSRRDAVRDGARATARGLRRATTWTRWRRCCARRCPNSRLRPRRARAGRHRGGLSRPQRPQDLTTPMPNAAPHPQGRVSRRRPRHPLPARHQDRAEGNAADHRQAADPVRRRRGDRSRLRHAGLRHQPLQARGRRLFRQGLRARTEARDAPASSNSWS